MWRVFNKKKLRTKAHASGKKTVLGIFHGFTWILLMVATHVLCDVFNVLHFKTFLFCVFLLLLYFKSAFDFTVGCWFSIIRKLYILVGLLDFAIRFMCFYLNNQNNLKTYFYEKKKKKIHKLCINNGLPQKKKFWVWYWSSSINFF